MIFWGIVIGVLLSFITLIPFIKKRQEYNAEIELKNSQLEEKNVSLNQTYNELTNQLEKIQIEIKNNQDLSQKMYNSNIELMQEKLDRAATDLSKEYQQAEEKYQQEYFDLLEDLTSSYQSQIKDKQKEIHLIDGQLKDIQNKFAAAIKIYKSDLEKKEKDSFYCLQLTDQDILEIKKLREIEPYLRDKEPLNKVIWKVYYEKPYTDLVGRVFGNQHPIGIYKITNMLNKKCYVGQATDTPRRWQQHIKRGIGAENPTNNKLYPAMLKDGVENFKFEFIEECPREKLNEREQFWQNFLGAKTFGYSIK